MHKFIMFISCFCFRCSSFQQNVNWKPFLQPPRPALPGGYRHGPEPDRRCNPPSVSPELFTLSRRLSPAPPWRNQSAVVSDLVCSSQGPLRWAFLKPPPWSQDRGTGLRWPEQGSAQNRKKNLLCSEATAHRRISLSVCLKRTIC